VIVDQTRVLPATSQDSAALSELFRRAEVACHCRYWHFGGDKNAWLDRCFNAPAENAREFSKDLEEDHELSGVVAYRAERAIGWLKLTPVARVQKLYEQRLYRKLPCFADDRSATYAVGCVLVDPEYRRQGVASRLLAGAISECRAVGGRRIEAFPRRAALLGEPELWMGPYELFERQGFAIVNDFAPYPVLRLEL
jgi:GNAT superfamily N-acetyltransferase